MYDFRPLEAFLDELVSRGAPYVEVAVRRAHEPLFRAARGAGGADKRFFLYSCSKPLTVAGAMRLWEAGRLDLDAPVSDYLKAYENAYLMENGARRAPKTKMTIRHLFTMSAGLDYDLNKAPIREAASKPDANTVSVANAFALSPLCFDPGDRFQYSLCHDALAAVVEVVSGRPFDEYMRDEVFAPLGMTGTSFAYAEDEIAPQYRFENGSLQNEPIRNVFRLAPKCFSGGAGVVGTLSDLSLFTDCLACGGEGWNGYRLLKRETIDLIRTEQLTRLLRDPTFGCAAGPGYGYGLGVRTLIDRSGGQKSSLGEFGWDGAAGAYEMSDPATGISIAFVMHILGWITMLGCPHATIRDIVFDAVCPNNP